MQKPNLETEEQLLQTADVTLRKYLLHIQEEIKLETLSHFLNMLLVDTFRIKGFVYLEDTWYLVNAVGNMLYIEPCSEKKKRRKYTGYFIRIWTANEESNQESNGMVSGGCFKN